MSATYLYLLDPETVQAKAELLQRLRASREEYEDFMGAGARAYPHEVFERDCDAEHASGQEVSCLAHALVINGDGVRKCFMEVELDQLLLDCDWLAGQPCSEDDQVIAFARARDAGRGFRIQWQRPGATGQQRERPAGVPVPPILARLREMRKAGLLTGRSPRATEEGFVSDLKEFGLSDCFAHDAVLLNNLCNNSRFRPVRSAGVFPMWTVAGWDNYEGHLSSAEFGELTVAEPSGFLQLFRQATEAGAGSPDQLRHLDQLVDAREQTLHLGDGGLCLAISSV